MFKVSGICNNTEARRALKDFPKGLAFKIGWCLRVLPMQMHVQYKGYFIVTPLIVQGDREKLTEEQILKRTINALYRYTKEKPADVLDRLANAMYWDSRRGDAFGASKEESELLARIYLENFKSWYKDWVKNGRKVNVE